VTNSAIIRRLRSKGGECLGRAAGGRAKGEVSEMVHDVTNRIDNDAPLECSLIDLLVARTFCQLNVTYFCRKTRAGGARAYFAPRIEFEISLRTPNIYLSDVASKFSLEISLPEAHAKHLISTEPCITDSIFNNAPATPDR
jgi:hypothetical protein